MRIISLALLLLVTDTTIAEVTTLKEADIFLEKYCISLVNEIEITTKNKNYKILSKDWKGEYEVDIVIKEIADVYNNLCINKKQ